MSAQRVTSKRILLAVALLGSLVGGACTLNPQPLPPEDSNGGSGPEAPPRVAADATTSDAGTTTGSSGSDGGAQDSAAQGLADGALDAPPAAEDGGDAAPDAPSDAPSEGG